MMAGLQAIDAKYNGRTGAIYFNDGSLLLAHPINTYSKDIGGLHSIVLFKGDQGEQNKGQDEKEKAMVLEAFLVNQSDPDGPYPGKGFYTPRDEKIFPREDGMTPQEFSTFWKAAIEYLKNSAKVNPLLKELITEHAKEVREFLSEGHYEVFEGVLPFVDRMKMREFEESFLHDTI